MNIFQESLLPLVQQMGGGVAVAGRSGGVTVSGSGGGGSQARVGLGEAGAEDVSRG